MNDAEPISLSQSYLYVARRCDIVESSRLQPNTMYYYAMPLRRDDPLIVNCLINLLFGHLSVSYST
jgi:hypothetical protein